MTTPSEPSEDPREQTPLGHYLNGGEWDSLLSQSRFFSIRELLILLFFAGSTIAVAVVLWMKPPHFFHFDAQAPAAPANGISTVKRLRSLPAYDHKKFEEIDDDDIPSDDDSASHSSEAPAAAPTDAPRARFTGSELAIPSDDDAAMKGGAPASTSDSATTPDATPKPGPDASPPTTQFMIRS